MGTGKIDITKLENNGNIEFPIILKKQTVGTVSGNYEVKNLPPAPVLIVKNLNCTFLSKPGIILDTVKIP